MHTKVTYVRMRAYCVLVAMEMIIVNCEGRHYLENQCTSQSPPSSTIMPPKLSKADREKLRKEEAERKAREEEERRAREEEEERERLEKERIEKEEAARRQELQDARIAEETEKVRALQTRWIDELESWKKEQVAEKEWNDYLLCSQLPTVTDEKSLNTWISQYKDTPLSVDIPNEMEDIKNCLMLCSEVERVMDGDRLPLRSAEKIEYYKNTIQTMKSEILSKLSLLTRECSLNAESYINSETYNLTLELSLPGHFVLCLWGNVAKNPRLKDFTFKERSFTLVLPKPLILADIIISVLYPPFDSLTPLARSYMYQTDNGVAAGGGGEPVVTLIENSGDEKELTKSVEGEGEGEKEGGGEGEGETEDSPNQTEIEGSVNKEAHEQEDKETGEAGVGEGEKEIKEEGEVVERVCVEREEDEVDLRRYRPAGGPIVLNILELPAPPKNVGQWTIRRVASVGSQTFVYPQELSKVTSQPTVNESEESIEGGGVTTPPAIVPGCTQWPPIEITMNLPKAFKFSSEPYIAQWDEELNIWRTNRLKDVVFDMNDNSVTLQTYHFSPLAIMVDQYANMPYRFWELAPKGLNHTVLKLGGAIIDVAIEIKDRECVLLEPSEEPSLSHLLGQTMSARQLISGLKKSGVNFDPEPDGHKYCSIQDKNLQFEVAVYQHIAMAAGAFKFSHSCWNKESGRGQYVLQCVEVKSGDENSVGGVYVCGGEKSWKLAVSEDSKQFSMDIADNSEVHGNLYSTLLAESSTDQLPANSPSHTDTLNYCLSHVKPLTYCL